MNHLFHMDNGLFRGMTKIFDGIYISIIFLLTCIPVFTIGTSLTALYYTVQKVLKHDRGYIGREYWHAFRTNFKQGTCIWLIVLAVGVILYGDVRILKGLQEAGNPLGNASLFFEVLLILEIIWSAYLFPCLARFENTSRAIMKNAVYIAILNLPRTILLAVVLGVAALVVYFIPVSVIVVPVVVTLVQSLILEKIFRKYMSEEDRATEDEMNQEYRN